MITTPGTATGVVIPKRMRNNCFQSGFQPLDIILVLLECIAKTLQQVVNDFATQDPLMLRLQCIKAGCQRSFGEDNIRPLVNIMRNTLSYFLLVAESSSPTRTDIRSPSHPELLANSAATSGSIAFEDPDQLSRQSCDLV